MIQKGIEISLSELKIDQKGIIIKFLDDAIAKKLIEMGLTPGQEVSLKRLAPFNGAMYLKVNRNQFAIRLEEARQVIVQVN